jgi:DNA-directed RNA polymerase subunit RPC12/RpoP
MKASCRKCGKEYSFADSRIPEEGFTYKCPRCGNGVFFGRESCMQDQTMSAAADPGTNPIVRGSYAGALAGFGCAIPVIMMTMLGIGLLSLGMKISGYSAAGTILMVFLKMLSVGVLIGISLAFIGAKTDMEVWSLWGVLIGTCLGGAIGLISGIFMGTVLGGVFGIAIVFGAVIGWMIKAALVTTVVILIRRFALSSDDEGPLSAALSARQMTAVGVLFFLMVFTIVMEMKGSHYARAAVEQAKQELSAEGLQVADQESSFNDQGDLIVTGKIVNNSKDDKQGWLLIAEMRDDGGSVIRKATLMNGMQMHSIQDAEILKKRNQPFRRPEPSDQRKAALIKAGDSVPFEFAFLEAPKEYKEIDVVLKNFDENSMREILTDKLEDLKKVKAQAGTGE